MSILSSTHPGNRHCAWGFACRCLGICPQFQLAVACGPLWFCIHIGVRIACTCPNRQFFNLTKSGHLLLPPVATKLHICTRSPAKVIDDRHAWAGSGSAQCCSLCCSRPQRMHHGAFRGRNTCSMVGSNTAISCLAAAADGDSLHQSPPDGPTSLRPNLQAAASAVPVVSTVSAAAAATAVDGGSKGTRGPITGLLCQRRRRPLQARPAAACASCRRRCSEGTRCGAGDC